MGVEMLQNTAVKKEKDLESKTAQRRGNTWSISGKTATGTKAFPLSGAPRASGAYSDGAEQNLELFRTTVACSVDVKERLNSAKSNWKQYHTEGQILFSNDLWFYSRYVPNWESHVVSEEGKILALQIFLPGLKIHHCYLFNPSHRQWNINMVTSKNTCNPAWRNNKGKYSDGVYQDSPDGSHVELAPSSFSGPRQKT